MIILEPWVFSILADPISKLGVSPEHFKYVNGVMDARIFLKNTYGYEEWSEGQFEFESSAVNKGIIDHFREQIAYDRPVYEQFRMSGRILDVGGGAGTVREFLVLDDVEFISTDPWLESPFYYCQGNKKEAYSCLNKPLNFLGATAEFLPFVAESFDWVHMRSMLDHVQVVDLALLEARRVLKPNGHLLIGLYVEGGKSGAISLNHKIKDGIKDFLQMVGIDRWKDHHIWHPTYSALIKLILDNGFAIEDTFWQPHWNDTVCYISALKKP